MFDELDDFLSPRRRVFDDLVKAANDPPRKLGAWKNPKRPKIAGSSVPGSAPTSEQAGTKTQVPQAPLTPEKKLLQGPTGSKQSTVFTSTEKTAQKPKLKLTVSAFKKMFPQVGEENTPLPPASQPKPEEHEPTETYASYVHPPSEKPPVVTNTEQNKIPVTLEHTPESKWYSDKVKMGDTIHYTGIDSRNGNHVPMTGQVVRIDPDARLMYVLNKKGKEIAVPYHGLRGFARANPEGILTNYQYPGEHSQTGELSPTKTPQPALTPEQLALKAKEIKEHKDNMAKLFQSKVKPGDLVAYYAPTDTGDYEIRYGHLLDNSAQAMANKKATESAAAGVSTPAPKAGGGKVLVFNHEGKMEPISINMVQSFSRPHPVLGHLEHFGYDPKTKGLGYLNAPFVGEKPPQSTGGLGEKAPDAVTQMASQAGGMEKHPEINAALNATLPSENDIIKRITKNWGHVSGLHSAFTEEGLKQQLELPADYPMSVLVEEGLVHQNPAGLYEFTPKVKNQMSAAETVEAAKAKYLGEHGGNVYFRDPESNQDISISKKDLTHENVVHQLLSARERAKNTETIENLKPEQLNEVKQAMDYVEKVRESGEPLPNAVLTARHNLLDGVNVKHSVQVINNFIKNPVMVEHAPPHTLNTYMEELGIDHPGKIDLELANDLWSNKNDVPASYYLQTQQTKVADELQEAAKKHYDVPGVSKIASEIEKIPLNVDNRKLIDFYRTLLRHTINEDLKAQSKPLLALKTSVPRDEHVDNVKHFNELSQHLADAKLLTPTWQNKIDQLGELLNEDPGNPEVNKLFNEIHNYEHEGENNPVFQFDHLYKQFKDNEKAFSTDPEMLEKINAAVKGVNYGLVDPKQALNVLAKALKKVGINPQVPPVSPANRYMNFQKHLYDLTAHKLSEQQHAQTQEDIQNLQMSNESNPAGIQPQENTAGMQLPGTTTNNEALQQKAKKILERANNNYKLLQDWQKVGFGGPDKKEAESQKSYFHNALSGLKEDANAYEKIRQELAAGGVELPPFHDLSKLESQPEKSEATEALDSIDKEHKATMSKIAAKEFNHRRNVFLTNKKYYDPMTQQDLENMNNAIELAVEEGEPLNEDGAKTELGKELIRLYNEYITQASGLNENKKSLSEMVNSEKTIARRDISLALRKSFFNDKASPELKHATELLSAYFDDFIEVVFNQYQNIPLPVRKSINRKLVKALIRDVVKYNPYSAMTMREDFTAPLNEDVIKSIGREIAEIVTQLRMDVYKGKTLFVVDLEKSSKHQYATTQINLPAKLADKVNQMAKHIPDEDLAGEGRTDRPHITVRYGITSSNVDVVRGIIESTKPFVVHFGKTKIFPPTPHSDGASVVVCSIKSEELHKLNKAIENSAPVAPSDFTYTPHVTIAYVKSEVASKYDGMDDISGEQFRAGSVAFRDKNGKQETIALRGIKRSLSVDVLPLTTVLSPSTWFNRLSELEKAMYDAGLLDHLVSPHRIRKFITDNDQEKLLDFYNEAVSELKNGVV